MTEIDQEILVNTIREVVTKIVLESENRILEELKKSKTPVKKTPVKPKVKTPAKKISHEKAYEEWVEGLKDQEHFSLKCSYGAKCGQNAGLACRANATYMLTGEPSKRSCVLIPKQNIVEEIIGNYGIDPRNSYPYIRCNSHKNVCLNDSISTAVEFIGTLDNGAVVHAEDTSPSVEKIAASLSGKPMSPAKDNSITLLTPEYIIEEEEEETGASGPRENISLPVVEENNSQQDNTDLEDLLNTLQ